MRRTVCLLLILVLAVTGLVFTASAEGLSGTRVPYGELPEEHRALYEKELASAKANAKRRAPGQSQLLAEVRGDFNGYTGSKSDNSLKVSYRVSDSVVEVGEAVYFYVDMTCDYPPMIYTIGGVVFDESFNYKGDLTNGGVSIRVDGNSTGIGPYFVPTAPGYFNFVLTVSDGIGNRVAVTTNTVQVYQGDPPTFENVGADQEIEEDGTVTSQLAMSLNMSRESLKVGQEITASVVVATTKDPVTYTAYWTHTDASGNTVELDDYPVTGQVNAQGTETALTFDYTPFKAGKLQFVIEATDGNGNHIRNNSPILTIADAYHLTAKLNRLNWVSAGETLTATYTIQGHECDTANYYIGWETYDVDGNVIATKTSQVDDRSGKSTFTPRYGSEVEFYVGASCSHITGTYPATDSVQVLDGLEVDLSLTATTVKYGKTIGVKYTVEGGLAPYQEIIVTGYSYDKSKGKTYTFLTRSLTDASATVTGSPKLGDEVYFVVKVVESDGNTTSWKTGTATLTGAPEVTDLTVEVTGVQSQVALGDDITLTYAMSGGSGTIDEEHSSVTWTDLAGTVLSTGQLLKITGDVSFTPTQTGGYYCQLVLTDDYGQQITWKSDLMTVINTLPGDSDGNGRVEPADVLLIMQYDAGWSVTVNRLNADVDDSGSITLSDAVLILRYLAGEGVTLK